MQIILDHFPKLTDLQKDQFGQLQALYEDWNSKINVISRKDIDQLYERHILHSLAIAKLVKFKPFTKVLDLGTGGGMPGIPLAIMFPRAKFHLVDSIGKKLKVVEGVVNALELENVTFQHERVEKLDDQYDFVVSRAVAPLPKIMEWTWNKVVRQSYNDIPNGWLCLKGGDLTEEIKSIKKKVKKYPLYAFFPYEYFEEKHLLYISNKK